MARIIPYFSCRHGILAKLNFLTHISAKDKQVFEYYLNKCMIVSLVQYDGWFLTDKVINKFLQTRIINDFYF